MSLETPSRTVEKLQKSLHAKAKSEPGYRFYSLWDKVTRQDVLAEAYRRSRANRGAAGVDGEVFDDIEFSGVARWLGNLRQELAAKQYAPMPLRRMWIPKSNGGRRPLGIPTIRDRVVQMAVLLVLGPIFEADLLDEQYGFREGLDAKTAVRRVYFHLRHGRREVVDGDLRDYFNAIPHGPLMKSVARRIADGTVLSMIRSWLNAPVSERTARGDVRTTTARDGHRGTPQGGVISPLLANLYFRRFALAFRTSRVASVTDARLVNYADDFVLCCRTGTAAMAAVKMRELMARLGLEVNEEKTKLVQVPGETFDFLGYTFGRFYGKGGRPYVGTAISKKAISRVLGKIHDETSRRWNLDPPEKRVEEINRILRGWCGYFDQGPIYEPYRRLRKYTERRLRKVADAEAQAARHRVPPVPGRVSLREARPLQPARASARPGESEGVSLEGEPCAGDPHARFDERALETELRRGLRHRRCTRKRPATATPRDLRPPRQRSTLPGGIDAYRRKRPSSRKFRSRYPIAFSHPGPWLKVIAMTSAPAKQSRKERPRLLSPECEVRVGADDLGGLRSGLDPIDVRDQVERLSRFGVLVLFEDLPPRVGLIRSAG